MFRNKILLNTVLVVKPNIKNNCLKINTYANVLPSARQKFFLKNYETNKSVLLYKKKFIPKIINNEKYMSQTSEPTCWKCKKSLKMKNFNCTSCGVLQPPKPNVNFFELLGVSQTFDINLEELTKKFRDLQKIFHPDKVANKSEEEKTISEIYSRLLNKAYNTLKDPISRGFYLLEHKKDLPKTSHPLDPKFLSLIMEKNEELESLDDLNSLKKFSEDNNEEIAKHFAAVQSAFSSNKLLDANSNLLKLNYLINLNEKIKERETKLKPSNNTG